MTPSLPSDTPIWLIVAALIAGWFSAKVWPLIAAAIAARAGATTDILRAKAKAELARVERETEALEHRADAEQKIADALIKLSELVQSNVLETRQNTQVLTSLSTAFSVQIGQMPTLRDMQQMTERIGAIEAHLALSDPMRFGRRDSDTRVWAKREGERE